MDDVLAKKLLRNVRILNGFIIFFSLVIITIFTIAGILTYKVLTAIRDTKESFTSLETKAEESLDFQSQLCDSNGSVAALLKNQTDVCQ